MQFVDIHTHHPTGRHIEPSGFGVHPWYAADAATLPETALYEQAQLIGEIGLDYSCAVSRQIQAQVLNAQLAIAAELQKPVVLHCVRAFEPMMKILARYPIRAVIFHGFIGSGQQAQQAAGKGYFLSFGQRSFRSPKTVKALQWTPLQNLFFETDDAEVGIETVYELASEAKGLAVAELQAATLENYKRIFE